jgi:4-diphosphocytidyl-2-C-methyl-D-erythritol kinase
LWDLHLSDKELCVLGASLGSDVPFCLYGGTALATNRGEVVSLLPDLPTRAVVLAKPPIGVATAHVYGQYRPEAVSVHPDTKAVLAAVHRGDWQQIESNLINVLESVTIIEYPQLAAMKELMLAAGATGSLMSGSGPTVFCLAEDEAIAIDIARRLNQSFEAEVIVTRTAQRQSRGGE